MRTFSLQQRQAIDTGGNVLVVAGAGTGKTTTLVARCLRLILEEQVSLDSLLLVTFTEAAATEMRQRIRQSLDQHRLTAVMEPRIRERIEEQLALLDTAAISTLHSFCLELVRQHFDLLGVDPAVAVLDPSQTRPLLHAAWESVLRRRLSGAAPDDLAVQDLIRREGRGDLGRMRSIVMRLHHYLRSLPYPDLWLDRQMRLHQEDHPRQWEQWFIDEVTGWRASWITLLESQAGEDPLADECLHGLSAFDFLPLEPDLTAVGKRSHLTQKLAALLALASEESRPRKTKPTRSPAIKSLLDEASFLRSYCPADPDPLEQDWAWARPSTLALLGLLRDFGVAYQEAKANLNGIDFADQEQLAMQLLYRPGSDELTEVARQNREQFHQVFVDEYQDISPVQDAILRAISREGDRANRFLVGDVKQSIYRFRHARPAIFRAYQAAWSQTPAVGTTIPLTENYRSSQGIIQFVNSFFEAWMRDSLGGMAYDNEARLQSGDVQRKAAATAAGLDVSIGVELGVMIRPTETQEIGGEPAAEDGEDDAELSSVEKEARWIAARLRQLRASRHPVWDAREQEYRPVAWNDMAILLRSPANRVETYAQQFHRLRVPLTAGRAGFFDSLEVMDLVNLLRLLDNPQQDIPLLAVLRSPLVGLSIEELAVIRVCDRKSLFWQALHRFHQTVGDRACGAEVDTDRVEREVLAKASLFLERWQRWRQLTRHTSLSHCLETVLTETHYEAWLQAEDRGPARVANVRKLVDLVRQYDPLQRQGLYRFLRFVAEQEEMGSSTDPVVEETGDAVRILSIHQSKGLEFPVVVVAGLGSPFNEQDLRGDWILSDAYGLCPRIYSPEADSGYPSLAHWLACRRERSELLGEELRLLYVAFTRARDFLLLLGSDASKNASETWRESDIQNPFNLPLSRIRKPLDWIRGWFQNHVREDHWTSPHQGASELLRWRFAAEAPPMPAKPAVPNRETTPAQAPMESGDAPALSDDSIRESPVITESDWQAWREKMSWSYQNVESTKQTAKTTVTDLQRHVSAALAEDSAAWLADTPRSGRSTRVTSSSLSAARSGTGHHRFLELVDLGHVSDVRSLAREADRLAREGWLSAEEQQALNLPAIAAFWKSATGLRILSQAGLVQRELAFTARFSIDELRTLGGGSGDGSESLAASPLAGPVQLTLFDTPAPRGKTAVMEAENGEAYAAPKNGEFLVVQGVVDLVVIRPEEIWLLDYKTDAISLAQANEKASFYQPQLHLYGLALSRIYRRPVTRSWLHFLAIDKTVEMT